ncbi:unnamed protein product [Urochloa humidicola]
MASDDGPPQRHGQILASDVVSQVAGLQLKGGRMKTETWVCLKLLSLQYRFCACLHKRWKDENSNSSCLKRGFA